MNVRLNKDQKIPVVTPDDLYRVMQQILLRENKIGRSKEHFWVVCLNAQHRILLIELMGLGSMRRVEAEPMDIFSFALQKRATSIILVHNHPSGNLKPSQDDMLLTQRMWAIGRFVNLPVLDHMIITETGFLSFSVEGHMEQIEEEKRFDLFFSGVDELLGEIDFIKAQKEHALSQAKTALKKVATAQRKERIAMAKKMLREKEPVAKIVRYTGLTKKEVEGLRG